MKKHFLPGAALIFLASFSAASAATSDAILIDDFEKGAGNWTLNDSEKAASSAAPAALVDIVTLPQSDGATGNAARISFKAANKAWASASTRVDGAQWARIGARSLTFSISGDGATQNTELVLRGRYASGKSAPRDESFSAPIRLVNRDWRRVVIPLNDFHNASGALLPRLSGVYLLQFVQRGTWQSRFFTVDDIRVEGTGVPLVQAAPSQGASTRTEESATIGGGNTAPANVSSSAATVRVTADFLTDAAYLRQEKRRSLGRVRTTANVGIGGALAGTSAAIAYPLLNNSGFRVAIKTLGPRYVRLEAAALCEVTSSSRPSFEYSRLVAAVKQVRALGSEPLISLGSEPLWGLDARGYALFATGAARAANAANPRNASMFELATATSPSGQTQANSAAFYNGAYAALKTLSKNYRVGGAGFSTTQNGRAQIAAFLKNARGLDFLSVQHFGAFNSAPSDDALATSSLDTAPLRAVGALLDRSRFRSAPLYVTQANLNATRDASTLVPSDARNVAPMAAAWWLSFLGNNSRVADQIFHNDAVNAEWGLLQLDAQTNIYGAYPAYYGMWMWNRFAPVGSERVFATTSDAKQISVFAVNARGAHNVLLANNSAREVTVKIAIRGFPKLRAVRLTTLLDNGRTGVRENAALPKSATQTITLKPFYIATVQFLEPAKR